MKRFLTFVFLFALTFGVGACDGLFGGSSSGAASSQDGGPTCDKDWQALSDLLAQPAACTTSGECPTGSYCDGDVCTWQCYADSDCGAGRSCSCDGVCSDGETPVDPGVDRACPRNQALLDDPATRERECLIDEQCPYGARCDGATATCAFDCVPGSCDPGLECDCRGQCVEPGAIADAVEPFGYRLEVSTTGINLADAPGVDPEFEVALVAGVEELAFATTQPSIRLAASDGVELTVRAADGSVLASGVRDVDVSAWQFVAADDAWRAGVHVTARVVGSWTDDHERIRITGRVGRGFREVIIVDEPQPSAGEWAGAIAIESEAGDVELGTVAWGDATGLVFFDDWNRLTSNGRIEVGALGSTTTLVGLDDDATWRRRLVAYHVEQNMANGAVDGRIRVERQDGELHAMLRYHLRWVRGYSAAACGACAADSYCASFGRCVPGAAVALEPDSLQAPQLDEWGQAASWLEDRWAEVVDVHFVEKLFCAVPSPGDQQAIAVDQGLMIMPGSSGTTPPPQSQITEVAGELTCDDGSVPNALAFNVQRDLASAGDANTVTELAALLSECLEALEREAPAVGDVGWGTWYSNSRCVAVNKVLPAVLKLARGSIDEPEQPVSRRGTRMLQRILSQWIAVHSFVGREAREETELAATLDLDDTPDLSRTVELMAQSWEIVLDERVQSRLQSTPAESLRNPDYREPPGPIIYWTFDEDDTFGDTHLDRIGDAHVEAVGPFVPATDRLLAFGDVELPFTIGPEATRGDLTIMWIGAHAGGSQKRPVLRLGPASAPAIEVGTRGGTSQGLEIYAEHLAGIATRVSAGVGYNTVHHFAVVRDAAHRRWEVYVDGALVGSPASYGVQSQGDAISGIVGVAGQLVELAVYDSALSQTQIAALHARGISGEPFMEPVLALADSADGEQKVGLPVAVLEGATEYVRTVDRWASSFLAASQAECDAGDRPTRARLIEQVGLAARTVAELRVLARSLADRAQVEKTCTYDAQCADYGATCGAGVCEDIDGPVVADVPWLDRYREAQQELAAAEAALTALVRRLDQCGDPLGLSPNTLPLYFGDLAADNGRFFASSDYILDRWATPAIDTASARLASAQGAWASARSSEIQEILTSQDRELRLEQVEASAGAQLIRMCGLERAEPIDVLGQFRDGDLQAGSCYLAPGCSHPARSSECARGELGQLALGLEAARADLVAAISAYEDAGARWRLQNAYCTDEARRGGALIDEIEAFERDAVRMRHWSNLVTGVTQALANNPASVAAAWSDSVTTILGVNLEQRRLEFDNSMRIAEIQRASRACFHEYRMMGIGILTHGRHVERALVGVQAAYLALSDREQQARQVVVEANAAVVRERGRQVPSIAHHYWVDEHVDRYRSDFQWAQRLTYLALLAAEYELQVSFPEREAVIGATNPDQLTEAVRAINERRATRTINGRRPTESSIVLSLRDDVLRLGTHTGVADGERAWDARTRFGQILASPAFAIYDEYGAYMGQGIPFDLEPQGALKLRCAERLWRVGATIQGDIVDADAPGAYMVIRKRNSFGSQWCEGHSDGNPQQVGTLQPTGQLFASVDATADHAPNPYSSALLFPWFNVPRSQFFQSGYVEGSSEELAGRGAYGEYILLFPEYGMLDFTSRDPSERFDLSKVEDVLIRFDLLSVDDIQGF